MWGGNEPEQMSLFYGNGLKLTEFCPVYGTNGRFETTCGENHGELRAWIAQTPLEVVLARVYGQDAVWCDTTHNACRYFLKTGPLGSCDWSGYTCPVGLLQVPEEEIDLLVEQLIRMGLDIPQTSFCTDGGSAWGGVTEALQHDGTEDTFHNDKNADKKLDGMTKANKVAFEDKRKRVLYNVMPEADLDCLITEMRELAVGSTAAINWVDHISNFREKCCATHTTSFFICSEKGATSRCESCQSRLKARGTIKANMRHWTLAELLDRHHNCVDEYLADAKADIENAIQQKRHLSDYVLDVEKEELNHVADLKVIACETNVVNPFHGVLRSSKSSIPIYAFKLVGETSLGLSVKAATEKNDDGDMVFKGLLVVSISKDSTFAGTNLHDGMIIHSVDGNPVENYEHGLELFRNVNPGWFRVMVLTVPSIGSYYTVCRKSNNGGKVNVFIPNKNSRGTFSQCQSDFHIHTAYWARCRNIQRALMEHPERSMKDLDTIHRRWHLENSPLYPIVLKELQDQMHVVGLGNESVPRFLLPEATTVTKSTASNEGNDEQAIPKPKRIPAPARRFHDCEIVAKQIGQLCKESADVYKMVMPQLNKILENAVYLKRSSSSKIQESKDTVKQSGRRLPVAPEAARRTKADDINRANLGAKQSSKSNYTGKRKGGSTDQNKKKKPSK